MSLTRADLENDLLRATFRRFNPEVRVLSDAEQEASLRGILDQRESGADVWLFGYGSLVWNPIVHHEERRVARLHGFHRSFCLWSHVNRGSLQRPGLVLGVDSDGETLRAIAFFVNREHPNYAGKLPLETVIKTLVSARGQLGTPAEYLLKTVRGLIEHGVRDPYLLELRKRVLAMHPELAPAHAR